ncbi:MAG: DUF1501 domain-containing protein [Candidatus Omnitrophica bacterium]|nr:DUF1501 domain-containing protein [Candidatus Omnitrophota bacterium]
MIDIEHRLRLAMTRRQFFGKSATGIGTLALGSLLGSDSSFGAPSAIDPLAVKPPHFAPKAKRVIYLFMSGGPSHLDLLDHKPLLKQRNGQPIPDEYVEGQRFAFISGQAKLLGSPFEFHRHGKSGQELSELLPHIGDVADDIAIIRSMHTEAFNHDPAVTFIGTGSTLPGRPTLGAWLTYGLGSENKDLPGFVVLLSGGGQPLGTHYWGSGFLPSVYQGVQFRSSGDPVLFVSNPEWIDAETRRSTLDAIVDLNEAQLDQVGDPEISTRINSYEMAYRMQTSVPELMDISKEPESVHEMYGTEPGAVSYANNCLLARRLVERGVRHVQLFHRGWDHHGIGKSTDIVEHLPMVCEQIDQPTAALLKDLKQRGLLEDTLVVWGGEFGRTPMNEGRNGTTWVGRDHHPRSFSIWMAGGGVKPGITLGATDEIGYNAIEDRVHVHDFQATILHLMGFNHEKLTYRFQGRDFRLTDVSGQVVEKLLL